MSLQIPKSWLRLRGFMRKEFLQIRRDPSSILLSVVMPVVLLFLFGFGMSLNPERVQIALVNADGSELSRDLVARFEGTPYFEPLTASSMRLAEEWVREGRVDGILHLRADFSQRALGGGDGVVQLLLNGVDANRANLIRGYVTATVGGWGAIRAAKGEPLAPPAVQIEPLTWFNPTGESRNFLVPGLIALIMTLIGTLLTALVIAREWERGTMEAILVTPLKTREFLLGKTLPYFALGMFGMALSVAGGVWLFDVPLRGSLWLLIACSALFLLASLGLGLAFSASLRVQFVAAQAAVLAGFLPAFFLSGVLFDLESTPKMIQRVSHIIPARYFVDISHSLFMAGDIWPVILPSAGALAIAATVLFVFTRRHLSQRLE